MAVLFCLVAWMKYYQGSDEDDIPKGGGSYVAENQTGSEIHNFTVESIPAETYCPSDENNYVDVCQGFVMCQGQIHIEKLGASKDDDYVDGVTVVWIARDPDHGKVYVTGWYQNARIYRYHQDPDQDTAHEADGCYYNVQAKATDCTLVPEVKRRFHIPKAVSATSGGIGRSNVWFAQDRKNADIVRGILRHIENFEP